MLMSCVPMNSREGKGQVPFIFICIVEFRRNLKQKPQMNADRSLKQKHGGMLLTDLLSYFSYISQAHLAKDDTSHGVLGPLASIIN